MLKRVLQKQWTANGPNHYWIDTLIYKISEMLEQYSDDTKPKVFIKHLFDVCQLMTAGFMYWESGMDLNYKYSTDEFPNEIVIGEYKAMNLELEREMKQPELFDDLIKKAETSFPDEYVPAEYLDIIEDTPDLEIDLPDDNYTVFNTQYFNFEERQFIDKYLYGWIITDLYHIQYLYKEDQKIKEEYDRKIYIVNIVQEVLKPMEILAFDSCLGGNEVWYGGGEALKYVRRCAGNGNGLSDFGIEIDDYNDFYSRLILLYDLLDELIEIIDNSSFLSDISQGYIRRFMREVKF